MKDNSKLIGQKRKRTNNLFNENGEESNETKTTGNTFTMASNKLKKTKENPPSKLNEERGIIESLPLIRKAMNTLANKEEKFIKINNTNIKQGSFLNRSKRRNPRKRWRKKNQKYFLRKKISKKNLNRSSKINSEIENFVNQKIKENAKKMSKKFSDEIKGLKKKEAEQDKKIAQQDKKITEQDKKIKNQNNKIGLLLSINHHSDIYSQKMENYVLNLGFKFNKLINSFKVLYTRKICNFILNGIINNYGKSLALTRYDFYAERKNFKLIVFKKNVKHISKYYLNLIIDFLMETKQNTSNIIHIHKDDIPIMKEIFFILFNKDKNINENENSQFDINIQEMADFILPDDNIENEKQEEATEKQEEQSEEKEEQAEEESGENEEQAEEQSEDNGEQAEEYEDDNEEENEEPEAEGKENEEENEQQIEEKEEQIEETENEENKRKNEKISRNNNVDNELHYYENYIKKNKHTKELLLNKNNNDNLSIKFLSQVLEKKFKKSKKGIKKFSLQEDIMINQSYFYNLWKDSFEKEEYKQTEEYETFIKTEYIQSSSEMKELITEILPGYQINLFSDDPS